MNLHGLVSPLIAVVNPHTPAVLRISTGQYETQRNGERTPAYATPGRIFALITDDVLIVTQVASGVLQPGQSLLNVNDATAVLPNTTIVAQLSGDAGNVGTYSINREQTVDNITEMTTALTVSAQVQPLTWRDLQQLEGLNLGGERRKVYLYGEVDAIVRVHRKGGDLITIADGVNRGTWLVAQTLEQFPDWVSCACTLQNE